MNYGILLISVIVVGLFLFGCLGSSTQEPNLNINILYPKNNAVINNSDRMINITSIVNGSFLPTHNISINISIKQNDTVVNSSVIGFGPFPSTSLQVPKDGVYDITATLSYLNRSLDSTTNTNIMVESTEATLTINFNGVGPGWALIQPLDGSFNESDSPNKIIKEFPKLFIDVRQPFYKYCLSLYSSCKLTFTKGASIQISSGGWKENYSQVKDIAGSCDGSCSLEMDSDKMINITMENLLDPQNLHLDSLRCTNLSIGDKTRTVQLIAEGRVSAPYMVFEAVINDRNFTVNSTELKSIQAECWGQNETGYIGQVFMIPCPDCGGGVSDLNKARVSCLRPTGSDVSSETDWKVILNKTACLTETLGCDATVNITLRIALNDFSFGVIPINRSILC